MILPAWSELDHLVFGPGTPDPLVLLCDFKEGRKIDALVLFFGLKKLRIWYADGGGEEWLHVDFRKDPVATSIQSGRGIILNHNGSVALTDDDELDRGKCHAGRSADAPRHWLSPKLKQPWEEWLTICRGWASQHGHFRG